MSSRNLRQARSFASLKKGFTALLSLAIYSAINSFAADQDALVQDKLRAALGDKVVTLRNFYSGSFLEFHSDGTVVGQPQIDSWTLSSKVQIAEVRAKGRRIVLKGKRLPVIFQDGHRSEEHTSELQSRFDLVYR